MHSHEDASLMLPHPYTADLMRPWEESVDKKILGLELNVQ